MDTPTKTDLLPCPFGKDHRLFRTSQTDKVYCTDDNCPIRGDFIDIEQWNTRTQPTADIAGLDEALAFFKRVLPIWNDKDETHAPYKYLDALEKAARLYQASHKGAVEPTGKTRWVRCPICDEPDMRFTEENDADGFGYVQCVNLGCPSNDLKPKANRVSGADYAALKALENIRKSFSMWPVRLQTYHLPDYDIIRARLADQKEG